MPMKKKRRFIFAVLLAAPLALRAQGDVAPELPPYINVTVELNGLAERLERVRSYGGQPVNRKDPRWASIFTPVPDDASEWAAWEQAGADFVADVRKNGPVDYAVSHAGERAFSRSFQLLSPGGVLTFFGASGRYRFSFLGKAGKETPRAMLQRARLSAGKSFLVIYGPGAEDGIVDPVAIEAIEIGCGLGAKVAVLTDTIPQRELVTSLGFGSALGGVVSVEELRRRFGAAQRREDRREQ